MGTDPSVALAALQAELGIDAQYPIDMPQEAWLSRLGDLDDDQLFAVATAVLAIARYVVARRQELPVQAIHVHAFASTQSHCECKFTRENSAPISLEARPRTAPGSNLYPLRRSKKLLHRKPPRVWKTRCTTVPRTAAATEMPLSDHAVHMVCLMDSPRPARARDLQHNSRTEQNLVVETEITHTSWFWMTPSRSGI